MHMRFTYIRDQVEQTVWFVNDLTCNIIIDNCLTPTHKLFPRLKTSVNFDSMNFEFDVYSLKRLQTLGNQIQYQMKEVDINHIRNKLMK